MSLSTFEQVYKVLGTYISYLSHMYACMYSVLSTECAFFSPFSVCFVYYLVEQVDLMLVLEITFELSFVMS